jgi:DNA-binding PadR family transcriptional regulator
MKQLSRSDEIILVAVHCRAGDAYSTTIQEEIESRTGRRISVGSLWVSLDGLCERGYVRKEHRQAPSGGRPRVYYSLSPKGRRALLRAQDLQRKLWDSVPPVQGT